MSKVFKVKNIQELEGENMGLCIDFGCDSEDDDWERKEIEKEDEEIRDFVKGHPMPSPDDEEGKKMEESNWQDERSRRIKWNDNIFIRKI